MEAVFDDDLPDVAIASFLTALTIKGETPEEVAGFAKTMRRHAVRFEAHTDDMVDTAGTGGGAETFNISTTAAFVIAAAGLPVAKHGNRAVTSRSGSADLLTALGVRIDVSPEVTSECIREVGIGFMFAPMYHPAMKRVVGIRKELGHRTVFNMLGPLTNPAGAGYQIIGVYAPDLTERLAHALVALGCRRAWVVHSADGLDELSVTAPTRVSEVANGAVRSFEVDPAEFGFASASLAEIAGGTPEENAEITRGILDGATQGPKREIVLLNAAAALSVAGRGELKETLRLAAEAIDSGEAMKVMRRLVEVTNG